MMAAPRTSIPFNAPGLAQIGSFFNNKDATVLSKLSASVNAESRLEKERRSAHMKHLQNLQWGFVLDNPKLRYVYGDRNVGKLVGPSFSEREHFLNSIGVETIELTSVEMNFLEKAKTSAGHLPQPMSAEERHRVYSKLKNKPGYLSDHMQIAYAMEKFTFPDFMEAWSLDETRRYLRLPYSFEKRHRELANADGVIERVKDSKMCIVISYIIYDFCKGEDDFGLTYANTDRNVKSACSRVYLATRAACGDDFIKGYGDDDISTLQYFLDPDNIDPKCLSIMAYHLQNITTINSNCTRGGSFHLIPLLIQGDDRMNLNFSEFIMTTYRTRENLEPYWKSFSALSLFVTDLTKLHDFTDDDLKSEMLKYIDDPEVPGNSSMRDYLWENCYFMSRGFTHLTFDRVLGMKLPKYGNLHEDFLTGVDYEDDPDDVDDHHFHQPHPIVNIPKNYLQVGQRFECQHQRQQELPGPAAAMPQQNQF